jgi:hypothetical protein
LFGPSENLGISFSALGLLLGALLFLFFSFSHLFYYHYVSIAPAGASLQAQEQGQQKVIEYSIQLCTLCPDSSLNLRLIHGITLAMQLDQRNKITGVSTVSLYVVEYV